MLVSGFNRSALINSSYCFIVEYSGKVHLQEASALEPLLKLLRVAEDADVLLNVMTAIRLLVEHYECQTRFIELQGISVILSWISSEYRELQKLALETLECLMRNKECRSSLQEADGLAKVTEFIAKQVSYYHYFTAYWDLSKIFCYIVVFFTILLIV